MRPAGRSANQVRPVTLTPNYGCRRQKAPCWSNLAIPEVLCTASIDEGVPRFLKGQARLITAEYAVCCHAPHTP